MNNIFDNLAEFVSVRIMSVKFNNLKTAEDEMRKMLQSNGMFVKSVKIEKINRLEFISRVLITFSIKVDRLNDGEFYTILTKKNEKEIESILKLM